MTAAPHLRRPSTRVRASFVGAVAEFRAEGLSDRTLSDQDLAAYGDWTSPDGFAAYVDAQDEARLPPGRVASTRLWWTWGSEYLGGSTCGTG